MIIESSPTPILCVWNGKTQKQSLWCQHMLDQSLWEKPAAGTSPKKSTSTLISQTSSRSTMLPWEELTCWMHILHAVSFPSGPVAGIWYFFWHVSVAVINAWLLYQRDCEAQGIPTSKVLKLRKFQGLVAEGLFQVGTARSRGRPTTSGLSSPPPQKFVRVYKSADVRFDQIAPWPVKEENHRRCAVCKDLKTEMHFEKYAVPLCINKKRNCFKDYYNV